MDAKRNDPCPCGSGLKYKKCHGKIQQEIKKAERSYTAQEAGKTPLASFASKIIHAIEAQGEVNPIAETLPESKASTKEAENPELTPPRKFKT